MGHAGQDAVLERCAESRSPPWDYQEDLFSGRRLELGANGPEIIVGVQKNELLTETWALPLSKHVGCR
jgi:hypothetical protein